MTSDALQSYNEKKNAHDQVHDHQYTAEGNDQYPGTNMVRLARLSGVRCLAAYPLLKVSHSDAQWSYDGLVGLGMILTAILRKGSEAPFG